MNMIAVIVGVVIGLCILTYAVRWFFRIDAMIKEVRAITEESKATASMLSDILAQVRQLKREAEGRYQQ